MKRHGGAKAMMKQHTRPTASHQGTPRAITEETPAPSQEPTAPRLASVYPTAPTANPAAAHTRLTRI